MGSRTMRGRTVLVAGIGAAMITLAGCGGHGIAGSATPQGAGGAAAAAPGTSQKIASVADLGALVQHNASGKNSAHVQMAMTVPGAGDISAAGDIRFNGTQSAEQMTMTIPGVGGMQMVMVGTTIYLQLPAGLSALAGGAGGTKPWTKIDLNGDDALSKSLGSTAGLADQTDPTQLINKIAAAGTITNVTHENVGGVAATHYAITVDVAKMVATMGSGDAEKQAMSALGVKSMPFDIWVNSANLPIKIVTKLAFANPAGGGSSQVDMTVNYTNWGETVNIQAPPADQVNGG
jgi:hypothetical protein